MTQIQSSENTLDDQSFLPIKRSFVVQIEAHVEINKEQIQGRVEHIISGKFARFHTLEELLSFMESSI